jgi:hypothetical protein
VPAPEAGSAQRVEADEFQRAVSLPGAQVFPAISPDGRWLAYTSAIEGRYEVWAVRYPVEGAPIRVSTDGGELPRWSPRSNGLYYRNGLNWYWVELRESESEPFGLPRPFVSGNFVNVAGPDFAVSPDGQRLLLLRSLGEETNPVLNVITNWVDRVDTMVPR